MLTCKKTCVKKTTCTIRSGFHAKKPSVYHALTHVTHSYLACDTFVLFHETTLNLLA